MAEQLNATATRLGQHFQAMERLAIPGAAPAGGSFFRNVSTFFSTRATGWIGSQIDSEDTRRALTNASRIDHPTFANFITAFEFLYKALDENRSKIKIIQNINASLAAISFLIGPTRPTDRTPAMTGEILRHLAEVFRIPEATNQAPLAAILNELDLWNAHLTELNAFLEGKDEAHACTRPFLRGLLQETKIKLLHEQGPNATGFLNYLRHIKTMQSGNIAGGMGALIESIGDLFQRTITSRLNDVAGTSFGTPGPFNLEDDPSIPGFERLSDGNIQRHARVNSTSVFDVVMKLFGAFRVGEDPRNTKWRISLLIPILEYLQTQVIDSRNLSKTLTDLVALRDSNMPPADIQRSFGVVKEELDTCLIGVLRYLPYFPLSTILGLDSLPENGLGGDPVSELQATLQGLQAHKTTPTPDVDEKTLYQETFKEFQRTACWMAAYKTLSWLIGQVPDYVSHKPLSFSQIMDKIYQSDGSLAIADPVQQHEIFIASLLQNIDNSSHLFFLTRFFLRLLVPIIVHISNFTLLRVISGGKRFLDSQIASAHSSATGQSSTTLLDLFSETAEAYVGAHQMAARSDNLGSTRSREIIDHGFYRDPNRRFLRGHENKASVYHDLGEAIVDEFLASMDFTKTLSSLSAEILEWSVDSNWLIIQSIFWTATLPLRLALGTLNTLIFWPLEAVANTVLYYTAKAIVGRTNIAEQLTTLSLSSLTKTTDFTTTIDQLVLDLLKMLWELLQAPSNEDGSFSDLQTTPETRQALSKAISNLIEAVDIGNEKNTHLDLQNRDQRIGGDIAAMISHLGGTLKDASLDGISSLLDKSWQLLLKRGTKLTRLLLKTINRSMLSSGQERRSLRLAHAQQAEANQIKDQTKHLMKLLIWEAVKLATNHLGGQPDEESAVNAHIVQVRTSLGFAFQEQVQKPGAAPGIPTLVKLPQTVPPRPLPLQFQSKLVRWHEVLSNLLNNPRHLPPNQDGTPPEDRMRTLKELKEELEVIAERMQHSLSAIESGDSGRSAVEAHERNVLPITQALHQFQIHFSKIYSQIDKATCQYSDNASLHEGFRAAQYMADSAELLFKHLDETRPATFEEAFDTWQTTLKGYKARIQAGSTYLTQTFPDVKGPLSILQNTTKAALASLDTAQAAMISRRNLAHWINQELFPQTDPLQPRENLLDRLTRCISQNAHRDLKRIMGGLLESLKGFLPSHQIEGTHDYINYKAFEELIRSKLQLFESSIDQGVSVGQAQVFIHKLEELLEGLQRDKDKEMVKKLEDAASNLKSIQQLAQAEAISFNQASIYVERYAARQSIEEEILPVAEATRALQALEKGVAELRSITKVTVGSIREAPFIPMAQKAIYHYIKENIEKALRQLLTKRDFLEGYTIRAYIKFLEDHGRSHESNMRLPL